MTVHTHLCVSLLASNLAWLVWHYAVLGQHEVWSTNSVWCRAVNTATTFLTMTNYAWMLAEVTYLHISTQYLRNIYTISTHIYAGRLPPLPAGAPLPAGGPPGAAAAAAGLARTRPLRPALRCLPLLPRGHNTATHYLHTICTLSAHYLHTICTLHRSALCTSVLRDHAVTTYQ